MRFELPLAMRLLSASRPPSARTAAPPCPALAGGGRVGPRLRHCLGRAVRQLHSHRRTFGTTIRSSHSGRCGRRQIAFGFLGKSQTGGSRSHTAVPETVAQRVVEAPRTACTVRPALDPSPLAHRPRSATVAKPLKRGHPPLRSAPEDPTGVGTSQKGAARQWRRRRPLRPIPFLSQRFP
jgi:hypothetical protein